MKTGNMHLYKITQDKVDGSVRYFNLYQQTILDFGIADRLITPYYHEHNGNVYASSVCGVVT